MNEKIKISTLLVFKALACAVLLAHPCRSWAQPLDQAPAPTPATALPAVALVRIAGVVQFVEGRAVKTESGVQSDLVYQSSLFENDRIETTRGSALKIATRNGCTFVMRGENSAATPTEKKPWRFRGESVRALCSGGSGSGDVVAIANVAVKIREGEVLIVTEKAAATSGLVVYALALKGNVQIRGQTLEPRKLYSIDATAINEVSPQPSDDELRQLNLRNFPPRESKDWPKPPKPSTVRLLFGPAMAFGRVFYDNGNLNEKNLGGDGVRLQLHFRKANDTSLIFALTDVELQDQERKGNFSGANQPDSVTNRLGTLLLEAGHRFRHDRWWSPYYRFGVGYHTAEISIHKSTLYGSNYKYEFYVASVAAGIDAHLIPSFLGGLGVFGSAEAQAIQSLWRGQRENKNVFSGNAPVEEPWRSTQVSAILSLGLEYVF